MGNEGVWLGGIAGLCWGGQELSKPGATRESF